MCDVLIDEEYDKNSNISYINTPGCLRYIRKIADDADVFTDYFADADDEVIDRRYGHFIDFLIFPFVGMDSVLEYKIS